MAIKEKVVDVFEWIAAIFGFLAITAILIAIISGMAILILHA